jgi:superfamily II DNA or RNA helicase
MVAAAEHSILNLPGEPRMLDAVREGLAGAEEALLAVSFTRCSGLQLLIDPLQEMVAKGGRPKLLTSTYQHVTQPEALEALLGLKGVECRVQEGPIGFHTKFWWFRGQRGAECWAGSSNLTKGGLSTNLEWNIRSLEEARIEQTRRQFDALWTRSDVRPLSRELIHRYRLHRRPEKVFSPFLLAADHPEPPPEPNPAQQEALRELSALRERGERRAAVIAATGLGKTFLAAFDVAAHGARRVLYVSHRLEHLTQAYKAFGRVLRDRHLGLVGGGRAEVEADVVFATVQSLRGHDALLGRRWDYVIIDEFHHAEAPGYQPLRALIEDAFLLGMTATPERQDGHDVLEWCNWNIAYEVRLPEAIDRGWLLPFHYFGIADETVEFARIPWRNGRIPIDVLERELSVDARAELVLQQALLRGFDGPKRATVGFCASIRHAEFMTDAFRRRHQNAVAVSGNQSIEERERIYRRLADVGDPLEWLFVADILNEGVDIPAINSLLFLRPTDSAGLFLQQLGRGLRLFPGTEVLTVLDFVGQHRSSWITLQALHDPKGAGARIDVVEGFTLKPPRDCEVVLQRRTQEILAKIRRHTTRRELCDEAYRTLREELGRPPLPVDLWHREELPELREFRNAYGSWLECQQVHGDSPAWAKGLPEEHPVRLLLAAAETDWQAQRVGPYAILWGLAARPDEPPAGYEEFFRKYPQWRAEYAPLDDTSRAWETLRKKVPPEVFTGNPLASAIIATLGPELLAQVEGRLMYTVNKDHQERHGGVLRTPADLSLHGQYTRPEIVRHFGTHYDPARHNSGMLWFEQRGVIITKLDTSTAKETHRYRNQFVSDRHFSWTSQNKMTQTNEAGRKVIEHEKRGSTLHLFVQGRSHEPAFYLGEARVIGVEGDAPMTVTFELDRPVPLDIRRELVGTARGDGESLS